MRDVAPATLAVVQPDGTAAAGPDGLMFPNGAVITPDGATFIVGESFSSHLTAFDIGPDGRLENRRVWASVPGTIPDGCCYDAEGGIWYADAIGRAALRVLEGGEITHRVETELNCFAVMPGRRRPPHALFGHRTGFPSRRGARSRAGADRNRPGRDSRCRAALVVRTQARRDA